MMKRSLHWVFALILLTGVSIAKAQQPAKLPRIGVLTVSGLAWQIEALRSGLAELGYIEGKNIEIDVRSADSQLERLPALAAELVQLKPDVIVTSSNPAIIAVKKATQTIPVVMTSVGDPVGAGFVNSLARPGGNITGLSNIAEQLSGKRLELLKEIKPAIVRVAIVRNPTIPTHAVLWQETERAGTAMGLRLVAVDLPADDDYEKTFNAVAKSRSEALVLLPEPTTLAHREKFTARAAKTRLPTMYPFPEYVESGGLASYGPSSFDLWRRGASYVDKILKGRKPADLPVEQPMKFEFVINLKAAKQIGLTIPPEVLARASKIIR
jgi:putative ABC transport system substrate-binding protein